MWIRTQRDIAWGCRISVRTTTAEDIGYLTELCRERGWQLGDPRPVPDSRGLFEMPVRGASVREFRTGLEGQPGIQFMNGADGIGRN